MLQERINFKTYRKGGWQLLPSFAGMALLLLLFLALTPLPVSSAHAEGDNGATTFSAWLSPSVTLTMADSVSEGIEPTVSGTFKNLATVAHVEVNNSDYYEVSLHASSKDMVSSSTTNDPQAKISSITAAQNQASFTPNQWGYNLTKNATGVTTATPTTTDTEYQPIATTATAMPGIGKQATTNNAASDYYTLNFGAKVDTSIPAGLYSSTVTLSVVASPKQVTGFDRTDTMQGMTADICKEIGTDADLTNGGATKYAATDSLGNTYYTKRLKDTRDNKYYWVAKLKDGNCWMTQNLALDIPASGLTSELTALAPGKSSWKPLAATRTTSTPNRFTIAECAGLTGDEENDCLGKYSGYSWNEGKYVVAHPLGHNWALQQTKITAEQGGLSGFANPNNMSVEGMRDSMLMKPDGTIGKGGAVLMDVSGPEWQASTDPDFSEHNGGYAVKITGSTKVYDSHYLIGNYYQGLAATAQTVAEGEATPDVGHIVQGSICPKNWQLPLSGQDYNNTNGSYYNLFYQYTKENTESDLLAGAAIDNGNSPTNGVVKTFDDGSEVYLEGITSGNPLHIIRPGSVNPSNGNGYLGGTTVDGTYRSSVVSKKNQSILYNRVLLTSPGYIYLSLDYRSANGYAVRCLITAE